MEQTEEKKKSELISDDSVVLLTPTAVNEVKGMIQRKNLGSAALRIGVQGGGCSGLSYTINFDTEINAHDIAYEVDGLQVIIDKKSALYLKGTKLDFSNALVGGGFKFLNPNAKQSCGCGESFST
ncbi:MAG: HesB/IscA family protein [Nitrospiria bacterium]